MDDIRKIPVDYDSPIITNVINTLSTSIAEQTDNEVFKAVLRVGVDIDKDKLIAALSQDKQRYEEAYRRGHSAGYAKRDEEIVRCRDCKHSHLTYDGLCKQCDNATDDDDIMLTLYLPGDFYCGYGEQREDGAENG